MADSSALLPKRNMSFEDLNDVEETDALMSAASPSASSVSDGQPQAPAFKIPSRTIAAVEHPFLIHNLDKGLGTFGPNPQFQSVRSTSFPLLILIENSNLHPRSWTPQGPSFPCLCIFNPKILLQGQ